MATEIAMKSKFIVYRLPPLIAWVMLVLGATSATVAQGQRKTLPINPHMQHTPVWCWAASAAAAIEFAKSAPIQDCQVLAAYDQARGGLGACCVDPRPCLRGGVPGEIEAILGSVFNVHGTTQSTAPSFAEVVAHIDSGGPLIVWLWHSMSSAHVVLISGYDATVESLLVLDPVLGPSWIRYGLLLRNPTTGVWRDTLFVNGPAPHLAVPSSRRAKTQLASTDVAPTALEGTVTKTDEAAIDTATTNCRLRCQDAYDTCVSQIQSMTECMNDKQDNCPDVCEDKFGHTEDECQVLCQPTSTNVAGWTDLCDGSRQKATRKCVNTRGACRDVCMSPAEQ